MKLWQANVDGGKYERENKLFRSGWVPLITSDYNFMVEQKKFEIAGDSVSFANVKAERKANALKANEFIHHFIIQQTSNMYAMCKFSENIHSFEPNEIEKVYNAYTPTVQQSIYGKKVSEFIEKNKKVSKGAEMIDFTGVTIKETPFDSKSLRGKYVILDFWGSWCVPCRKSNPHLKELYSMYSGKGLEIISIAQERGVSLVRSKQTWAKAVEQDGLPWIQLLNDELKEKNDLVKAYNINAFPTKVLIDKNGVIIWKGVGEEASELDARLGNIFNK